MNVTATEYIVLMSVLNEHCEIIYVTMRSVLKNTEFFTIFMSKPPAFQGLELEQLSKNLKKRLLLS